MPFSPLPEVSVVMAVYNGAARLPETVSSILSSVGLTIEFVIVNDGSTDETKSILESIAAKDGRVRVVEQDNQGLTRALITGCSHARAPYIARQDAGDLSAPDRLLKQKRLLDADAQVAFASCWTDFIGPHGEHLWTARGTGVAASPAELLDWNEPWGVRDGPTCHPSVMFRSEAYVQVGGYRSEFYFGQDWDLWYRLAAIGKFQTVPESLYSARVDPLSISAAARGEQSELARLSLAAARARAAGRDETPYLRAAQVIRRPAGTTRGAHRGNYFIGEALRRRGDARAGAYFREAVRSHPFYVKAWIRLAQTLFSTRANPDGRERSPRS